jgi:hypothetical protein
VKMTLKNRPSVSPSPALRATSATDLSPEEAAFGRAGPDVAQNTSLLGPLVGPRSPRSSRRGVARTDHLPPPAPHTPAAPGSTAGPSRAQLGGGCRVP